MRQCNACPDWLACLPPLPALTDCLPWPACLLYLLVSPTLSALSALACLTVPSWLWLGHVLRQNTRNLSAFSYQIEVCLGSCLYVEDVQLLFCLPDCLSVCPTVSLAASVSPTLSLSIYPSLCACLSAPLIWPNDMTVWGILRLIMA